jgi:hypothetical protein
MPVDQPQRSAEQVDARRDDRRPDAVVVENERLHQIVEMALVVGDVDDAPGNRRLLRDPDVLVDSLDLPQDGIEGVLQRAINRIALRRPQLVEVGVDPLSRLELGLAVTAPQVSRDVFTREDCLSDLVEHQARTISEPNKFVPRFRLPKRRTKNEERRTKNEERRTTEVILEFPCRWHR